MIEVTTAYDKHLNAISDFAELVYWRILPHTDDCGRFDADPVQIKARCFPLKKKTETCIYKAMCEIIEIGLWQVYKSGDKIVLQYNREAFNRINAVLTKNNTKGSEYPEPDGFLSLLEYQKHVEGSCLTRHIISKEYKVKGKEYKVEGKKEDDLNLKQKQLELEIMEYQGEFPLDMLKAFWNYWSEPNLTKTKMKKELEKTWDTKRRLETWKRNGEKFNKNGTNGNNGHSDTLILKTI